MSSKSGKKNNAQKVPVVVTTKATISTGNTTQKLVYPPEEKDPLPPDEDDNDPDESDNDAEEDTDADESDVQDDPTRYSKSSLERRKRQRAAVLEARKNGVYP